MAIKIQGTTVITDNRVVCANTFVGDGANLTGILYNDVGRIHYFSKTPPTSCGYIPADGRFYSISDYPAVGACLCQNIDVLNNACFEPLVWGEFFCAGSVLGCGQNLSYLDNLIFVLPMRNEMFMQMAPCDWPRSCANSFLCNIQSCMGTVPITIHDTYNEKTYGTYVNPLCFNPHSNSTHLIIPNATGYCGHRVIHLDGISNRGGYSDSIGNDANTCFTTKYIAWAPQSCLCNYFSNTHIGVIKVAFNTTDNTFCCCGCLYPGCCDLHYRSSCGLSPGVEFQAISAGTVIPPDGCVTHVMLAIASCYECLGTRLCCCPGVILTSGYSTSCAAGRTICCFYNRGGTGGSGSTVNSGIYSRAKSVAIGNTNMVTAGVCGWQVHCFCNGAPTNAINQYACCTCTIESLIYDHDNKRYIAYRNGGGLYYSANGDIWTLGQCTLCCVCDFTRAGTNKIIAYSPDHCIMFITCDGGTNWSSCSFGNNCIGSAFTSTARGNPRITPNCQCILWPGFSNLRLRICDISTKFNPIICNIHYDPQNSKYIAVTCTGRIICTSNLLDYSPWFSPGCASTSSMNCAYFNTKDREIFGVSKFGACLLYTFISFDDLANSCTRCSCVVQNSIDRTVDGNCVGLCKGWEVVDCYSGKVGVFTCGCYYTNVCYLHDLYATCDKGQTWNMEYKDVSRAIRLRFCCGSCNSWAISIMNRFYGGFCLCATSQSAATTPEWITAYWNNDKLNMCRYADHANNSIFKNSSINCNHWEFNSIYYDAKNKKVTHLPVCIARIGFGTIDNPLSSICSGVRPGYIEDPCNNNNYLVLVHGSSSCILSGKLPDNPINNYGCFYVCCLVTIMDTVNWCCKSTKLYALCQACTTTSAACLHGDGAATNDPLGAYGKVVNGIPTFMGVPLVTENNSANTFITPCYVGGYIKT